MKFNQRCLLIFCVVFTLGHVTSLTTNSQLKFRTTDPANIYMTPDKTSKNQGAPSSISSSSEVAVRKIENKLVGENLLDQAMKSGLEDGNDESERIEGDHDCLGSKITSQKFDNHKFHMNSRLCKGNWNFHLDHTGHLYLENNRSNIIAWKASGSTFDHYGSFENHHHGYEHHSNHTGSENGHEHHSSKNTDQRINKTQNGNDSTVSIHNVSLRANDKFKEVEEILLLQTKLKKNYIRMKSNQNDTQSTYATQRTPVSPSTKKAQVAPIYLPTNSTQSDDSYTVKKKNQYKYPQKLQVQSNSYFQNRSNYRKNSDESVDHTSSEQHHHRDHDHHSNKTYEHLELNLQDTGVFEIQDHQSNHTLFTSSHHSHEKGLYTLSVLDYGQFGNLVITNRNGKRVWSAIENHLVSHDSDSSTKSMLPIGHYLLSENGKYRLEMQKYGQLAILTNQKISKQLWSSANSSNSADAHAKAQILNNGILNVENGLSQWKSPSGTEGIAPFTLTLDDDANLVIHDSHLNLIWESGSSIHF